MNSPSVAKSSIRTVLGDIDPSLLGVCYAHEHIIIDESYVTEQYPDFLLADAPRAIDELVAFHAAGGRAMVDSMPCDCGRNIRKLVQVSRGAKVHIVCPTGIHLRKYYPPTHWSDTESEYEIALRFIDDIEQGVDRNDYSGAPVERDAARAGVIKVASGRDQLNAHEKKVFAAAARAHIQTGVPILTHTEQGTAALEQVEWLGKLGVAANSIVLSHTDRLPDLSYHREILSTGVFVEYDSAFRWPGEKGNPTRDLILNLFSEGYGEQIMLGMDAARRSYWRSHGGKPGLSYLLQTFWPQLEASGLSPSAFNTLFVQNPARAYSTNSS